MTALRASSQPAAWPAADLLVLRSRPIRSGTDLSRLSRFGDDTWWLAPAHSDAHYVVNSIQWRRFPPQSVLPLKAFALAALEHPFPLDLSVGRAGDLPNVATIQCWVSDLRVFAEWLAGRGIGRLDQVTAADLAAYRVHVMALHRTPGRKAGLFNAVRALWAYRTQMPPGLGLASPSPWVGASGHRLASAPAPGRVNKTPRIAPATMEPLLAWALRVVEDIGPDIRDAWIGYRQLHDDTHPSHQQYQGLPMRDRIEVFTRQARRDGTALPGHRPDGRLEINWSQLGRVLGQQSSWPPALQRRVRAAGLPVIEGSPVGTISGQVNGRPWRDSPITSQELPLLVRVLTAACFLTVSYLSGKRPGEVLNLEPGCAGADEETGELLLHGQAGKGRNRSAAADDIAARTRPGWSSSRSTRRPGCWKASPVTATCSQPASPSREAAVPTTSTPASRLR